MKRAGVRVSLTSGEEFEEQHVDVLNLVDALAIACSAIIVAGTWPETRMPCSCARLAITGTSLGSSEL